LAAAASAVIFAPLRAERQPTEKELSQLHLQRRAHPATPPSHAVVPVDTLATSTPASIPKSSHFCSFKLSENHSKVIKAVTRDVLDRAGFLRDKDSKDITTEWKGPGGKGQGLTIDFQNRRVFRRKAHMHVTLCYDETSPFFRCNSAYSVAPFDAPTTQADALSAMYTKWMKGSHGTEPLKWDGTVVHHQGRPTGHFDKSGNQLFNQWIMLPLAPAAPQIGGVKIADTLHITVFKIEGDYANQGTLKEDLAKALKAVNFQDEVLVEGHTQCNEARPPKTSKAPASAVV
jgi:hypothetical protein